MESLLNNLKKQVTCSICLDTYTKPKTIACLHTFCCSCLERHALTNQRQGKYRCPECQEELGLPEGNRFDNLPTSFLHNSLLSLLAVRQTGDGSEISCGICKKNSAEISYCFDCEKLLCPDCVNQHEVFRAAAAAFVGHKVTPVKQFQPQDYEAILKRKSFCSQQYHEKEVTRFYCVECQTCICQICVVTDHKNHNVDPLEKAADREKAKIMAGVELMEQKKNVYNDVMHALEETASQLEVNVTTAIIQVSQAAEQMIAKVRELEREAITSLRNTGVSRAEKLDCAKKQVQSSTKRIEQAVEFANNLVQGSSSLDVMQSNKNLEKRFKDLSKTPIPTLPVSSFLKFVSTIAAESLSLGFMAIIETDVRLSTVEGLNKNFQAGLEAEFVICRKKAAEELTARRKFDVEVFVQPAEQEGSLAICEKEDRNFQVKFMPKVPSPCNITVKINGLKLANSPFTVQVKKRRIQVLGEIDLKGEIPQEPRGIAVNSKGLVAVASREKNCILIFDNNGMFVRKLGCYGEKAAGRLNCPKEITYLNDDEILVADEVNHCIQQFNVQTGNFVKSFGKKGTGEGEFQNPLGVCVDGEGHVVVADCRNNRIQILTKDGKPVLKFGDSGPEKFNQPTGCIYHKNMLIVCDSLNHCLKVFNSSGKFLYKIGEKGKADGQLSSPWSLCVEKYGNRENLLVCDRSNGRIQQFTVEGCFTGKTVTELQQPQYIATTSDGRILVSDYEAKKIYVLK